MVEALRAVYFDILTLGQRLQITRELEGGTKVADFEVSELRSTWPAGIFKDEAIGGEPLAAKLGGSVELGEEKLPMHPDHMRRVAVEEVLCLFLPSLCPEPVFDRFGPVTKIELI